jgi:hypothetical protein
MPEPEAILAVLFFTRQNPLVRENLSIFCLSRSNSVVEYRAQARATRLGVTGPLALASVSRVPSPARVHISCAPSKIPDGGFSPIRLQTVMSFNQYTPAWKLNGVKHRLCMRPLSPQFEPTFIMVMPSCMNVGLLSI